MNNIERALKCARGEYQRHLVLGYETLGGSTLRGKAKSFACRYRESADNLLKRLKEKQIPYSIELGPRGGYSSARLVIEE